MRSELNLVPIHLRNWHQKRVNKKHVHMPQLLRLLKMESAHIKNECEINNALTKKYVVHCYSAKPLHFPSLEYYECKLSTTQVSLIPPPCDEFTTSEPGC